jgi:hypothetical protein
LRIHTISHSASLITNQMASRSLDGDDMIHHTLRTNSREPQLLRLEIRKRLRQSSSASHTSGPRLHTFLSFYPARLLYLLRTYTNKISNARLPHIRGRSLSPQPRLQGPKWVRHGSVRWRGRGIKTCQARRAVYLHVDLTPDLRCSGRQDSMVGDCADVTGHHATLWASQQPRCVCPVQR